MEEYNAKSIVRKYKLILGILFVVLCAVYIFAMTNDIGFQKVTASVIFLVLCYCLKTYFSKKYVMSALTEELNPVKYRDILNEGKIFSYGDVERVPAAFYNGDYQTTIDICNLRISDKKYKKYKYYYLCYIARSYFMLGDTEKLASVCVAFDKSVSMKKNEEKLRQRYPIFKVYSLYLKNDFAACREIYIKILNNEKLMSSVWQQAHTRFQYAVICYKFSDLDTAKQNFEFVVSNAPKLNFADVSRKYLECMENGEAYIAEHREILPSESFSMPLYNKQMKKFRIMKIAVFIAVFILVFSILYHKTLRDKAAEEYDREIEEFYSRVNSAVSEIYTDFEVIDVFSIPYNGEDITTVCVCDTEMDGWIAGCLYTYKESDKYYLSLQGSGIDTGEIYYGSCYPSDYNMSFKVTDNPDEIPPDAHYIEKMEFEDKEYYFCVLEIEKKELLPGVLI